MARTGRPPNPETLVARAAIEEYRKQQAAKDAPQGASKLTPKAKYEAAGNGRRLAGWNPPASGPNRAIAGLQKIRDRARDSSRNDWSGASGVQKWTTNLIGIGITPRFKRVKSKSRKQALMDLWDDHVAACDADCVLNYYGLQTLAVRSWLDAGEVFVRRRARFNDEGLPVPLQYQVIEADMVPLLDADTFKDLPQNHKIRSGIELDKRGRRVAYWVYKEHPGDRVGTSVSPDDLVRVAASDMAHIYEPLRPGQLRGVSMLAPILARLRNIENYDDATLTRQQLANLVVAFITRKLPPLTGDEELDGLTGQAFDYDAEGRPLVGLQPGLVQELDDGQDVNWSNPPEAGTNYSDYMRTQHLGTAAATGLPYEVFSGDIKDVSDRTLRVVINEFRRHAEQRQWQIIIPQFCQKTLNWFVDAAVLVGKVSLAEVDDIRRVEWSTHGWAHIHPVQDPQGKQLEVEAGFRSRSSVIGERGDDPDLVDEERAADKKREDDLGLTPVNPADAGGNQGNQGDQDGIDNNEYNAPPNAQMTTLVQAVSRLEGMMAAQPRAAAPSNPTEPVKVEIHNNIPQTTVQNVVEPTPVTVAAPNVSVAAPQVTVEAPQVQVEAPHIEVRNEVQPAEVNVNLPARKTETSIERDKSGNIVKATQIETDAE